MVVVQVNVLDLERGRTGGQVYVDIARRQSDRPENAVLGDTGVEIVDLGAASTGGVDIDSDE